MAPKFDFAELNNGIKSISNFNAENICAQSFHFFLFASLAISPVLLCVSGWRFCCFSVLAVSLLLLLTWWAREILWNNLLIQSMKYKICNIPSPRQRNANTPICHTKRIAYFMLFCMAWILLWRIRIIISGINCECGNFPFPNSLKSKMKFGLLFWLHIIMTLCVCVCAYRSFK